MSSVEIKLDRVDKIYRPGDLVRGKVIVNSNSNLTHTGIRLDSNAKISLNDNLKQGIFFESANSSLKSIEIFSISINLNNHGILSKGLHEFPFEFLLEIEANKFQNFLESFHGSLINLKYLVYVNISRGGLSKPISATCEFLVQKSTIKLDRSYVCEDDVKEFCIAPELNAHALPSSQYGEKIFQIVGFLSRKSFFHGEILGRLKINFCVFEIKNIEVGVYRIEKVFSSSSAKKTNYKSGTFEIQTIQIADGNVCKETFLPIYFVMPRMASSLSITNDFFSIEFEIRIVIQIKLDSKNSNKANDVMVFTETIPIELIE